MMKDWQQRVVDEKTELDGRLDRLRAFFGTGLYRTLQPLQQDLMQRQASYMDAYSSTLRERIESWRPDNG